MRTRFWGVPALVAAFGAGWVVRTEIPQGRSKGAQKEKQPASDSSPLAGAPGACPQTTGLDVYQRGALVAEVTKSIADLLDKRGTPATEAAPPGRAPITEPDAHQLSARKEADELIERALAAQVWTVADREAFRPLQGQMAASDRGEVKLALVRAINQHRLRIEMHGMPF